MTQWFSWLHFFGRRVETKASPWPPPAPDDTTGEEDTRLLSPLAAPVHIRSGSAVVRVENGVLTVEREGEPRFERPIELVSAVHIHGPATITSPCVAQLVGQGTPVLWPAVAGARPDGAVPAADRRSGRAQRAANGLAVEKAGSGIAFAAPTFGADCASVAPGFAPS